MTGLVRRYLLDAGGASRPTDPATWAPITSRAPETSMQRAVRVEWVGFASAGLVLGCGGAAAGDRPFRPVEVAAEVPEQSAPAPSVERAPLVRATPAPEPVAEPCSGPHAHECKGMNECKGLGGCKTDGVNECKGKNDCKGKGGCKTCD
jgi:hypothetical protein